MSRREFTREFEGQLELPEGSLDRDRTLSDLDGWDSMAALLFISLAFEKLGVTVSGDQVAGAKTTDELFSIVGAQLTN